MIEDVAQACAILGLPMISPEATTRCRDKLRTRKCLDLAGVSSARFALVDTPADAAAAAAEIGYPVVLKPRSLAGSAGVVIAREPNEVADAFATATGARYSTLPVRHGVLVEEFLDGPEVSVDTVSGAHGHHVVQATRKTVGFAPYFEEVAHDAASFADEPWIAQTHALTVAALEALAVNNSVGHTELKLTERGPVVVEVNARLGGDFIPLIGRISGAPDQVRCAAEVALGRPCGAQDSRERVSSRVEFVYPPQDSRLAGLDLDAARAVPGIEHVVQLAAVGDVLQLPPRAVLGRAAAIIAKGEDASACRAATAQAATALNVRWEHLAAR